VNLHETLNFQMLIKGSEGLLKVLKTSMKSFKSFIRDYSFIVSK